MWTIFRTHKEDTLHERTQRTQFEDTQNVTFIHCSCTQKDFVFSTEIFIKATLRDQFNDNTDRTLDVVFSRFRGFSFTITMRQKPKGVTRIPCQDREIACLCPPKGFCLRVIVKENPVHLEKTTSSVLSVLILIYEFNDQREVAELNRLR